MTNRSLSLLSVVVAALIVLGQLEVAMAQNSMYHRAVLKTCSG